LKLRLDNAAALALSIGQRVRSLRTQAGLTQEKLAYESGLHSKGTLSKIEAGHQLASVAMLELLARRLGVELLDLFVEPGAGHLRHDLIEATRGRPTNELQRPLRALTAPNSKRVSLPFREVARPAASHGAPTVLPLIGLDVAAGSFAGDQFDRGTRWVSPLTTRPLHDGCFVVRIVGRSMEPTLPDGAWAIFTRRVAPDPSGRVVIAQYGGLVDADTAASYTVKRFRGIAAPRGADTLWSTVHLEPDNPSFEAIVVKGDRLADLSIVAELVEPLVAPPPTTP